MKGTSFHFVVEFSVGFFMFCFAMLYLYCLVTLIISTFTEISEEFKMVHHHRLSDDVTPTTSSKKDATTTTDADDQDTSADNTTTVEEATVEEFVDAEYTHQKWMDKLLLNYFEYSILLHQMFIQFYQAELICKYLYSYISSHVPCLTFFSSHLQLP